MFKFDDVIHHWRTASPSQCCAWTRSLNDSSWTRSYFRRTWTERTVLLHDERLGMGIESRFLFRTGAKSTDSLESLASLLNDSAYRFRSRQMRRDVTHTLLWFGSERSKHVAAEGESHCAFKPNATGRQDPIQSERRDAYRANFSREKTGDKFLS